MVDKYVHCAQSICVNFVFILTLTNILISTLCQFVTGTKYYDAVGSHALQKPIKKNYMQNKTMKKRKKYVLHAIENEAIFLFFCCSFV